MTQTLEKVTKAPEHVVFSALADVVNSWEDSSVRVWGIRVSVNPSRFGVDEASSVRLRNNAGEGEIGKILVVPRADGRYLFKVPVNHTGGAELPELDRDGKLFAEIVARVLKRLEQAYAS